MALSQISDLIAAVGALGVAAFGLVDASKVLNGRVNRIGFKTIRARIAQYLQESTTNALGKEETLGSLRQNRYNGTDLTSQKAVAKSLIKLSFKPQ